MEQLPNEVLVKIFKNLPQKDLLRAARTCKSFSVVIDSFNLIDTLHINSHCDESFQPQRKYSKLKVNTYKPTHQSVLDNVGHCVESLKIDARNMNLADIVAILNSTPNVKKLEFHYVRLLDDSPPAEGTITVPTLTDVSLDFVESDPMIFSVLAQSSIVKIELRFYGDCTACSQFEHLVTLMNNQEKLTSFSVSGVYESNLFLIPMVNQKYQLKEFSIKNCDLEEWESLDTYLRGHVASLEFLSVHDLNWNPSTIVNQCTNLKKFSCHQDEVFEINTRPSIEELSLKARRPASLEKFPSVKKMSILQSSPEIFQTMSRSMTQLEELQVKFGSLTGLCAPTIKKLILQSLDSDVDTDPNFFVMHHNIESLIFYHTYNINDELLEAIVGLKKLRVLKIIGDNKMTSRAFKIIADNCQQLKIFEMKFWDQKFQKDDWICLHKVAGLKVFIGDATSKTFFEEW